MAELDRSTFFTSLGFLAVVLKDIPSDQQAVRAEAISSLIEEFCAEVAAKRPAAPPSVTTPAEADLHDGLLREALDALQLCLDEGEGLTFSSEQAADRAVHRIRKQVG